MPPSSQPRAPTKNDKYNKKRNLDSNIVKTRETQDLNGASAPKDFNFECDE